MTIERVGSPDPVSRPNEKKTNIKPTSQTKSDSINVSDVAKNKAEIYAATENVKLAPDVRADKVAEVKKKLEDPSYIDHKIIEEVAEKILESFQL
jgi:negative regulator of flagellin synthesis FlgM